MEFIYLTYNKLRTFFSQFHSNFRWCIFEEYNYRHSLYVLQRKTIKTRLWAIIENFTKLKKMHNIHPTFSGHSTGAIKLRDYKSRPLIRAVGCRGVARFGRKSRRTCRHHALSIFDVYRPYSECRCWNKRIAVIAIDNVNRDVMVSRAFMSRKRIFGYYIITME